ncbi:MAG: hypothetical protein RCG15_08865 [Candidatus Rickettsia vulgarisii]
MTTDERRYLDTENTILRTPNNLYNSALKVIGGIANKAILDKIPDAYKLVHSDLLESLTFGKGEAAAGLAYLYRTGSGVQKNEHKDKLFTAIGSKLGDETCKGLVLKRDHGDVEAEANNWIKTIKEIEKKYPNKDAEITFSMSKEVKEKIKNTRLISNMQKQQGKETSFTPSHTPSTSKTTAKTHKLNAMRPFVF